MPLLHIVDAFADRPFAGNQAAVCVLDEPREPAWMQQVAAEMGFSETAFLNHRENAWDLRWFTPTVEIDLCGHATLASAHVLWEIGRAHGAISFHTRSGPLRTVREGHVITLDFPAMPFVASPAPSNLFQALGITPRAVTRGDRDYMLVLDDEAAVRALAPDHAGLRAVDLRILLVTAPSARLEYDYVLRAFGPGVGIDEDAATGYAQCVLAPYWAERFDKAKLRANQLSTRGASFEVALGDGRVRIGGRAVTILRGELVV